MGDTGKIDEMKGRVKEAYGDLTDDKKMKGEGAMDKMAGKVKEAVENVREKIEEKIHPHDRK
jgi:uncharacterized protein YjbJ (UPF0337 family)